MILAWPVRGRQAVRQTTSVTGSQNRERMRQCPSQTQLTIGPLGKCVPCRRRSFRVRTKIGVVLAGQATEGVVFAKHPRRVSRAHRRPPCQEYSQRYGNHPLRLELIVCQRKVFTTPLRNEAEDGSATKIVPSLRGRNKERGCAAVSIVETCYRSG